MSSPRFELVILILRDANGSTYLTEDSLNRAMHILCWEPCWDFYALIWVESGLSE